MNRCGVKVLQGKKTEDFFLAAVWFIERKQLKIVAVTPPILSTTICVIYILFGDIGQIDNISIFR